MRLSTIKLSGFKSFVDPTTLHLPTNMTGVVGPNGCGKSNIIDAVRWVMGESSASRLRGDSLTDVIFSGSTSRKPVSQATVELIFDNSDHTITGEYAAFNEISVKRTVSRDGVSSYSLNGTKCRRRDITDLFLGTGLGPRSYSIIEQGMISQIIEARPEDLRVFLEEAAGISKYKERRKETETRIRHTRENLDRLNDLREEVGKQLEHLRRQARQAEQYQSIQAERRIKDAEWKALEFRSLDARVQALKEKLDHEETRLQQLIAEQREAERKIETDRVRREEASEALNKAQARVDQVGGTLARIEQQIAHQREMAQRLQRARDEAQSALSELGAHISGDESRLNALREAIAQAEPELEHLRAEDIARQDALRDADTALADWQQRWDTHTRAQSEAARTGDVERTRIEQLDRQTLDAANSSPANAPAWISPRCRRPSPACRCSTTRRRPRSTGSARRSKNARPRSRPCRTSSAARRANWPRCARPHRPRAVACPRSKRCSTRRWARSRAPPLHGSSRAAWTVPPASAKSCRSKPVGKTPWKARSASSSKACSSKPRKRWSMRWVTSAKAA